LPHGQFCGASLRFHEPLLNCSSSNVQWTTLDAVSQAQASMILAR
jgi:hypothetical protein